ncbi:MAG: hypothetical protein ACRDWV_01445, partial [Acidimicrobiales bacterium]
RHPSPVAIGLLELAGLVLLRLAYSGVSPPRPVKPRSVARAGAGPAGAGPAGAAVARGTSAMTQPEPNAGPSPGSPNSDPAGGHGGAVGQAGGGSGRPWSLLGAGARSAGRVRGKAKRKAAEVAPVADELLGRGARRLGGLAGRRAAKREASRGS